MNGLKGSRWFESLSCILYSVLDIYKSVFARSENHTYPLASVNVTDEVVTTVVDVGRVDPLECCGLLQLYAHQHILPLTLLRYHMVRALRSHASQPYDSTDQTTATYYLLRTVSLFLSTPEYVSRKHALSRDVSSSCIAPSSQCL